MTNTICAGTPQITIFILSMWRWAAGLWRRRTANRAHDTPRALLVAALSLVSCASTPPNGSVPRAGAVEPWITYKVLRAANPSLCAELATTLRRQKAERSGLKGIPGVYSWAPVTNLSPELIAGGYAGDIQVLHADLDNDGREEKVYRTRLQVGGVKSHAVYLGLGTPRAGTGEPEITFNYLRQAQLVIDFLGYPPWLRRSKELHGDDWEAWFYTGSSEIEAFLLNRRNYLIAYSPGNVPPADDRVYVIEILPSLNVVDVCMLEQRTGAEASAFTAPVPHREEPGAFETRS